VQILYLQIILSVKGHRGRDRMLVGFTTSYAISANLDQGEVCNIMW